MSIFKRLIIGNLITLLLVTIWGGIVTYKLDTLQKKTKEIVEINGTSLVIGDRLLDSFSLLVKSIQKYYVSSDMDYYTRVQNLEILIEDDLRQINNLIPDDEQDNKISETMIIFMDLRKNFEKNADLIKNNGHTTELNIHDSEFDQISTYLKKIINQNKNKINDNTDITNELTQQIFSMTIIITALTVLIGGAISLINTRTITGSIFIFKKKTEEISQGHYKELTTTKGPLEIRDLSRHFNAMSRRLSELDDLKGDFISHVSHELRTPITAIKEASMMLSKNLYSDQPSKLYELYTVIHGECDRLLKSVLRLLDYSKMEAKAMDYQFSEFDLAQTIRRSILKLAPLAQKKKIDLEFVPPPKFQNLSADADRIAEIMDNLIGNALKFTSENGKIIVACEEDNNDNKIVVSIKDNGCGIKPEYLKAIFEKFNQIDNGMGTRMGTGLGLSISKHIVKAHGGDIWAEKNYPSGTQFFFTLPQAS